MIKGKQLINTTRTTSGLNAHWVPVVTLDDLDDVHRPSRSGWSCVKKRIYWVDSFTEKSPRTFVRGHILVCLQSFPRNTRVPSAFLHSLTPRPMENHWQGVILYTLPPHWTHAMQMCPHASISGSNAYAVFLFTISVVCNCVTEAMPGQILLARPTNH